MDSDRRHDLETNDLKEFLDNFKDFWEKHGNKLLFVLIIAALAYAGPRYYSQWSSRKANDASDALAGATSPDALLAVAGEHDMIRDEATRRAGDLLLAEARDASLAEKTQDAEKALERAGSAYTALADRGRTIPYQLIGHEGLAKVAIMSGEWDKAAEHYDKLIELAGDTYAAQAARAQAGLDKLDLLKNPLAFAPPEPETVEQVLPLPGSGGSPTTPGGFEPVIPGLNLPDLTPIPGLPPVDKPADKPADEPAEAPSEPASDQAAPDAPAE